MRAQDACTHTQQGSLWFRPSKDLFHPEHQSARRIRRVLNVLKRSDTQRCSIHFDIESSAATPWLNGLCPKFVASYDPKHYSSKETDNVHFNASSSTSPGASEPSVISCCQLTKSLALLGRLKETWYGTLILFSQSETEILVLRDSKCIKEKYVLCKFFRLKKKLIKVDAYTYIYIYIIYIYIYIYIYAYIYTY